MPDIGSILSKIRALGADVVLVDGAMTISNGSILSDEQRTWISDHRAEIVNYLTPLPPSRLPPVGSDDDDTPSMTWSQTARIIYADPPDNMDPYDWSYFVTQAGKAVRRYFGADE